MFKGLHPAEGIIAPRKPTPTISSVVSTQSKFLTEYVVITIKLDFIGISHLTYGSALRIRFTTGGAPPLSRLTVVALTNTAFEDMSGEFPLEVRSAVYGPTDP